MKDTAVAGVRGMKNTYRFFWGNVSENGKMKGWKKKKVWNYCYRETYENVVEGLTWFAISKNSHTFYGICDVWTCLFMVLVMFEIWPL